MCDGIGELFILGFQGTSVPLWLAAFEEEFGLGGVVLFDRNLLEPGGARNIENQTQLRTLCDSLHRLPSRPLIFVDQEGGSVRRLKPERGFRDLPSHLALASLPETDARQVVAASFAELKAIGIDFNLAPVIDLNLNPENPNIGKLGRSFSTDPDTVRRCVAIMSDAARQTGLRLCLKHYPGLGGATTDSHLNVTDLSHTLHADQVALFIQLYQTLPGRAILLSHGLVKQWDPEWPVSVSSRAISRLRQDAPDALLITDDVQMYALRQLLSTAEASLRAWRAGADFVCIGNNLVAEEPELGAMARRLQTQVRNDGELREMCRSAQERVASQKAA